MLSNPVFAGFFDLTPRVSWQRFGSRRVCLTIRCIACYRETHMALSSAWKNITHWLHKSQPASKALQSDAPQEATAKALSAQATPGTAREVRAQRREQLFALVREHMIRAGVLTSAYKFKALTLDKMGDQFLVLMDVHADSVPHDPVHLAALETSLQKAAQELLQIEVKYVYWRLLGSQAASDSLPKPSAPANRRRSRNEFAPTQPMVHDDLETQYAQFR
jgi:hypothetical protein